MNIFLTSAAHHVLDRIIPHLPRAPEELSVAFIPTASDPYEKKPWLEEDLAKLKEANFNIKPVDLKNKSRAELEQECKEINIIFVAGGNTFYLLNEMRKSGFVALVSEFVARGGIYIGSSAGSVVTGPDIDYAKRLDDPSLAELGGDLTGLKLVDFIVLPHWGSEKYKERLKESIFGIFDREIQIIPLRDSQAIIAEGDHFRLI